ncbi:MAG: ATP-binding protein [Bacteroidales bacterium]|nr:ATP-binding protein [Bacteroidales bacterium]
MIERNIIDKIQYLLTKYPVVTITGTRQCGKSTLLRNGFPTMRYVSLEDPDLREFAIDDARGFLNNFGTPLIIDEAQYAPKLFSYIQTRIDSEGQTGMYILSGSHNFLLMESISQSLAGRTAILKMAPFSISELTHANLLPELNEWLFTGGFPRIYDKQINPVDFFPSYFQTYIERDVRLLRNINDLSHFVRFVKLCAARIGQLLNINALANECEVSVQTINSWLSVLETSYVIYLLKPYHNNFNKRLVKSPKLYFCDTGLAASLLGMENARQMDTHYLRGELFENMVIMEFIKQEYAQGREPNISFWRDSNQNEIDLLVERGLDLQAYEIKSSATMKTDYFKGLNKFAALAQLPKESLHVVYGGDVNYLTSFGDLISWKNIGLSK